MTAAGWAELAALIVLLAVTAPLLGRYMAHVYEGGPSRLDKVGPGAHFTSMSGACSVTFCAVSCGGVVSVTVAAGLRSFIVSTLRDSASIWRCCSRMIAISSSLLSARAARAPIPAVHARPIATASRNHCRR